MKWTEESKGQKGYTHAMERIPPSQKIGKKLNELLSHGLSEDVMTAIIRLGIERLVQEMLEQEVTDYLGREHYQRRQAEQAHRGYRNGYEAGRIRTAEGEWSCKCLRCEMGRRRIVRS